MDKEWCYQISIIDYLQTFDKSKEREVFAKKYFKRADPTKISAVKPDPYAKRYLDFMNESVFQKSKKLQDEERQREIEDLIKSITDRINRGMKDKLRLTLSKK